MRSVACVRSDLIWTIGSKMLVEDSTAEPGSREAVQALHARYLDDSAEGIDRDGQASRMGQSPAVVDYIPVQSALNRARGDVAAGWMIDDSTGNRLSLIARQVTNAGLGPDVSILRSGLSAAKVTPVSRWITDTANLGQDVSNVSDTGKSFPCTESYTAPAQSTIGQGAESSDEKERGAWNGYSDAGNGSAFLMGKKSTAIVSQQTYAQAAASANVRHDKGDHSRTLSVARAVFVLNRTPERARER